MTLKRRIMSFLIATLVIAGVVAVYYMPQAQQPKQSQPGSKRSAAGSGGAATDAVPVLVVAAKSADVPVYLDGVGTAKALNTVTVRPQVDGKLMKIAFKEGQEVQQGSVIAKIDPTIFQAQYDI